jgi:hypothetical protein
MFIKFGINKLSTGHLSDAIFLNDCLVQILVFWSHVQEKLYLLAFDNKLLSQSNIVCKVILYIVGQLIDYVINYFKYILYSEHKR